MIKGWGERKKETFIEKKKSLEMLTDWRPKSIPSGKTDMGNCNDLAGTCWRRSQERTHKASEMSQGLEKEIGERKGNARMDGRKS